MIISCFYLTVPESYEKFKSLLAGRTVEQQLIILERIQKCNHPSLAVGNKTKLEVCFHILFYLVFQGLKLTLNLCLSFTKDSGSSITYPCSYNSAINILLVSFLTFLSLFFCAILKNTCDERKLMFFNIRYFLQKLFGFLLEYIGELAILDLPELKTIDKLIL